jgi:alpha-glucosidase
MAPPPHRHANTRRRAPGPRFFRAGGFILAANFGRAPAPLPAHREVLLASGPVTGGRPAPGAAAWLSA